MRTKKQKDEYSLWNNFIYLLKGIWKSDRKLMVFMILESLCMVITPYIAMYLPKIGVDLVVQHSSVKKALFVLGIITCIIAVSQTVGNMAARGKTRLLDRLRSYYRIQLFGKTLDCDYEHVESARWQEQYSQAKLMSVDWGPWSATTLMSEGAIKVCGAVISFILYGSIIASLSPWMLLFIILLSVLNFGALRKAQKHEVKTLASRSILQRSRGYMKDYASDVTFGKDLRLYEMGGWIRACFRNYNEAHFRLRQDVQRYYYFAALVEAVSLFFRDGAAYLYFLWQAASGNLTPGEFVLACSVVASFSALVTRVSDSVGQMVQAVPPLNRMRSYLEAADEPDPDPAAIPPEEGTPVSITFEDVSFTYEGRYQVLDHFNLQIGEGEKIALVGINGAGKTTIVKLLCGFYKPESGRILINNTDIRHFRKKDLYQMISPVFQEATILPFTVAQNVSLNEKEMDMERIRECLTKTGLWEDINRLPEKMETMMMNLEDGGGVCLSGGQQQKLLMARALYKDAMLLFFDEPTAALDPIAESETYELFHSLAGKKTAIYISHRLASTRFCDRVVLLEKGRVTASGSHEELLAGCVEYAKMYRVQSHYYKKDAEVNA